MLPPFQLSGFVVACLAGIAVIVACNAYLLCCGRCSFADFYRVPPIGWLLILANLGAGILLCLLRQRRKRPADADHACLSCRVVLLDTWLYCPNCGQDVSR